VKAFLLGREQSRSLADYWTIGKSTVGTYHTIFDSDSSHHKFWSDEKGRYHAYLWLHSESSETIEDAANSWRMMIHPQTRIRTFAETVIACAEEQLLKLANKGKANKTLETVAYGKDTWLASVLTAHGYTRCGALDVYMRRDLSLTIDQPGLVSGYTIRPLDVKTEIVQRAGVQSDAFTGEFEPSAWAIENVERFLRWYRGRGDLDLVAATASGELASFAVFLVDPMTMVGELDPVGTRTTHQRKGLSKAILLSGLHYLKSENMRHVAVRTSIENTPAIRTYESVGFEVVDYLYRYTKT